MKKMMLALGILLISGFFTAKAQVSVVVRTPRTRVVLRGPMRPVVVRPTVIVSRPVVVGRPVVVARRVAIVRPRPVISRRVVVYR